MIANESGLIIYKHGALYYQASEHSHRELICKVPYDSNSIFSRFSVTERLLRLEPRFAYPIDDNQFYLSINGKIYIVIISEKTIHPVHSYRKQMHNPLNPCLITGMDTFADGIYYGEYWGNTSREEVSIFHGIMNCWEKVYTFTAGEVLHIHAIVPDEKHDCVYVMTGDSDEESAIWCFSDGFKSMEKVAGGSQHFRTCGAFLTDGGMFYATDTPLENNHLYYLDLTTGENKIIADIAGPCIYSSVLTNKEGMTNYYLATSVEPDSRNVGTWKYRLSRSPGPGCVGKETHLYSVSKDGVVKDLLKLRKDILPYQLFQFGNIRIPYQTVTDRLYFCPQSVRSLAGDTIVVEKWANE